MSKRKKYVYLNSPKNKWLKIKVREKIALLKLYKDSKRIIPVINLKGDETPKIAAEKLLIEEGEVLILNAGVGTLGLTLALSNRGANFYLSETNVTLMETINRNIEANCDGRLDKRTIINNAFAIDTEAIKRRVKKGRRFDCVIIPVKGYEGLTVISELLKQGFNYLVPNGSLYLLTHKKKGAERHRKTLENLFGEENVERTYLGSGGYQIYCALKKSEMEDSELTYNNCHVNFVIGGKSFQFHTEPGLFSYQRLDGGTRFLLDEIIRSGLKADGKFKIMDLGCGWGAIGCVLASLYPEAEVVLVDNDERAVSTSKRNIELLGLEKAQAVLSGNINDISGKFDLIVSNPPFHLANNQLIELFNKVRSKLKKGGLFMIVVEESFEQKFIGILSATFRSFKNIKGTSGGDKTYCIYFGKK